MGTCVLTMGYLSTYNGYLCTYNGVPEYLQWGACALTVRYLCTYNGVPEHLQWGTCVLTMRYLCTYNGVPVTHQQKELGEGICSNFTRELQ